MILSKKISKKKLENLGFIESSREEFMKLNNQENGENDFLLGYHSVQILPFPENITRTDAIISKKHRFYYLLYTTAGLQIRCWGYEAKYK